MTSDVNNIRESIAGAVPLWEGGALLGAKKKGVCTDREVSRCGLIASGSDEDDED
jgi:hypothetical protein